MTMSGVTFCQSVFSSQNKVGNEYFVLASTYTLETVVKDVRREEVKPPTSRSSESYRVITLLLDITITYKRS